MRPYAGEYRSDELEISYKIVVSTEGRLALLRSKFDSVTLETLKPDALGVDVTPRLKTLKVDEPPKRKAGTKVADAKALVDKLRNEAKVIA